MKELRNNHKITFPNPISTLRILGEPEMIFLLFGNSVAMSCFYAVSTGTAQAFNRNYGFDELQISLMFVCLHVNNYTDLIIA